jgi:hypothetical protein
MPSSFTQRQMHLTVGRTIEHNFALSHFITPSLTLRHLLRCAKDKYAEEETQYFFFFAEFQ